MFRITDVVKHLIIINVLAFIGTQFMGGITQGAMTGDGSWGRYILALFYPTSEFFQPYQVVTHMFMHGDLTHLFFNMFGLFIFGPVLETTWGPKRFLSFYFITALGAMLTHMLFIFIQLNYLGADPMIQNIPVLGASGALFGVLAGFAIYYPNTVLQLIFPPIAMKAKYFVLIYAALELYLGMGNFNTGVAHFAHLGGALFAVFVILYWRKVEGRY